MVGCWLFNEGTGGKVFDLSGNGNHGTFGAGTAAPTWKAGRRGTGLDFDGTDDYVSIPNFTLTFPATIIIWVNPDSGALSTSRTLLSRDGDTSFLWYYVASPHFKIDIYDGGSNVGTAGLLQEDEWQQIAITFDASGNGHHWYNGQQDLSFSTITEPTNPFELRIGEWSTYDWNGAIGSFIIYNRMLSVVEMAWLYRENYEMFL